MNGFINAVRVLLLLVIALASIAAASALLWRWKSPAVASTMATWQVLALIGLFLLPVATLSIILGQIHARRRRRLIERIERRARLEQSRERGATGSRHESIEGEARISAGAPHRPAHRHRVSPQARLATAPNPTDPPAEPTTRSR